MQQPGDENTPLAEVVAATHHMLHWRGVAADEIEHAAFAPFQGVTLRAAAARTVLIVTGVPRITSQHVRGAIEAMLPGEQLQLVAKHSVNLHSHFLARVSIVPWYPAGFFVAARGGKKKACRAPSLVLTYPLNHDLVPRHQRASPADLQQLAQLRLPRPGVTLPALRVDDPIAEYLALSVGDIVRIDRLDGTTYYRIIVSAGR